MITFQEEKFRDVAAEAAPLLEAHYKEIAMYQDKIEYSPDYSKYEMLDDNDMLYILTARDEGRLIGYFVNFVLPNVHYSKDVYAQNDILFIHPDYRGGTAAMRMFKRAEDDMRERGVSVMTIHMKTFAPFDKLVEKLEWDYAERIYTKCIKET